MKDQVLGASFLFGWQHSCDFVSECLEVKRHSCGASSAQTQLPGTGTKPCVFVAIILGVRH
jgi:hypothetical protein